MELFEINSLIVTLVKDKKICSKEYFRMKKSIINKTMLIMYNHYENLDKPEDLRSIMNTIICEKKANRYIDDVITKYRLIRLSPFDEE